jgi:hypothetical protein
VTTNDTPADRDAPKEGETAPTAGERERILAAVGWEGELRRRRVLRRLLQEQCQRIYLSGYAATHNRSSTMDATRRALLRTARSLEQVPESCPLSAWVFLALQPPQRQDPECPEPWRTLAPGSPAAVSEGETGAIADPARHREAHPGCGELQDAYRRFLEAPDDSEFVLRAGWQGAMADLDLFLEAQFGDENPQAVRAGDYWRQLMRSFRWSGSGMAAALIVIVVLVLAALFGLQWRGRHFRSPEHAAAGRTATPALPPGGPVMEPITGATVNAGPAALAFRWNHAANIEIYRLSILTPKLEPLFVADHLSDLVLTIDVHAVSGLHPGESYLFRVDGMRKGHTVASSGYTPFNLP